MALRRTWKRHEAGRSLARPPPEVVIEGKHINTVINMQVADNNSVEAGRIHEVEERPVCARARVYQYAAVAV